MEFNPLWMFLPLLLVILSGFPIGFGLGGIALIFGFFFYGPNVISMFPSRILNQQSDFLMVAVPLFIVMGNILAKSGAAEKLYSAMHVWMGPVRGGLALTTIIISTIFAAATGVAGAEIVAMGIIALPAMLKYGYDKGIACRFYLRLRSPGRPHPPQHSPGHLRFLW